MEDRGCESGRGGGVGVGGVSREGGGVGVGKGGGSREELTQETGKKDLTQQTGGPGHPTLPTWQNPPLAKTKERRK